MSFMGVHLEDDGIICGPFNGGPLKWPRMSDVLLHPLMWKRMIGDIKSHGSVSRGDFAFAACAVMFENEDRTILWYLKLAWPELVARDWGEEWEALD